MNEEKQERQHGEAVGISLTQLLRDHQDGDQKRDFSDEQVQCVVWAFSVEATAALKPGVLVHWFKAFITSLDTILVLLALLGNAATIVVLYRIRKQNLRLTCLLGSLVLSDLLTIFVLVIFDLPLLWKDNFVWVLGSFTCRVAAFLQSVAILVNSASVVAIAVDRYQAIIRGQQPSWWPEWRRWHLLTYVATVLILSCGVSVPYIVYYRLEGPFLGVWLSPNLTVLELSCPDYFCWASQGILKKYEVAMVCVIFLPMFLLFCASYIIIIIFLRRRNTVGLSDARQLARKRKVVLTVLSILATFLVCRLPSWLLLLVPQPTEPNQWHRRLALSYAHFSLHVVTLCAPAINPFLYTLLHQSYRQYLPGPLARAFWWGRPASCKQQVVPASTLQPPTHPGLLTTTTTMATLPPAHQTTRHLALTAHLATLHKETTSQHCEFPQHAKLLNVPQQDATVPQETLSKTASLTWGVLNDVTITRIKVNRSCRRIQCLPTVEEEQDCDIPT